MPVAIVSQNATPLCIHGVNNGQTCSATTRLIVPRSLLAEVEERVAADGEVVAGKPLGTSGGGGAPPPAQNFFDNPI